MKRTEFYLLDAKDDERAYIELSGEPNGLNTRVNIIVDKKSLTSEDRELVFVTYCSSLQEAIIRFKGVDLSTNTKLKKCDFDNISKFLIDKYKLKPSLHYNNISISKDNNNIINLNIFSFLEQLLTILLCISLGKLIANIVFNLTGIIIPTITGCMLVSVLFRNMNDKINIINLNFKIIDFLSDLSLGLFLTMALMSIDLFKLSSLFGPMLIIVICQAIFIILYSIFICFKVLGKNFDSAVMISGLIGHGLGATPTALANMTSITNKYGYSQKAFLVVPLVAAFLLDVFTMPCIVLFINILS